MFGMFRKLGKREINIHKVQVSGQPYLNVRNWQLNGFKLDYTTDTDILIKHSCGQIF